MLKIRFLSGEDRVIYSIGMDYLAFRCGQFRGNYQWHPGNKLAIGNLWHRRFEGLGLHFPTGEKGWLLAEELIHHLLSFPFSFHR
ncbi:MAG: hypothetical protein DDT28_01152 [Dehalococcoidia bacterium]|nr:hypothetical protein [Chloroflexota bacterium]